VSISANSKDEESSLWVKTSVANLVRYIPSGIYFARTKVGGKLIRRSLKTDKLAINSARQMTSARMRTSDFLMTMSSRRPTRIFCSLFWMNHFPRFEMKLLHYDYFNPEVRILRKGCKS
jgi:hypothetical protein